MAPVSPIFTLKSGELLLRGKPFGNICFTDIQPETLDARTTTDNTCLLRQGLTLYNCSKHEFLVAIAYLQRGFYHWAQTILNSLLVPHRTPIMAQQTPALIDVLHTFSQHVAPGKIPLHPPTRFILAHELY